MAHDNGRRYASKSGRKPLRKQAFLSIQRDATGDLASLVSSAARENTGNGQNVGHFDAYRLAIMVESVVAKKSE